MECPLYNFPGQFNEFADATFFMRPEVVMLLFRVQEECNKVLPLRIFNTKQNISMTLPEFDQLQTTYVSRAPCAAYFLLIITKLLRCTLQVYENIDTALEG